METLRIVAHQSMFILDGGPEADLPPGSGGPVLAGPEAIFVAGRIEFDAPTTLRVGEPGGHGDLLHAYSGGLATPHRILRVVSVEQEVLGEVSVPAEHSTVSIFLSDFEEPDEIFVAVEPPPGAGMGQEH